MKPAFQQWVANNIQQWRANCQWKIHTKWLKAEAKRHSISLCQKAMAERDSPRLSQDTIESIGLKVGREAENKGRRSWQVGKRHRKSLEEKWGAARLGCPSQQSLHTNWDRLPHADVDHESRVATGPTRWLSPAAPDLQIIAYLDNAVRLVARLHVLMVSATENVTEKWRTQAMPCKTPHRNDISNCLMRRTTKQIHTLYRAPLEVSL